MFFHKKIKENPMETISGNEIYKLLSMALQEVDKYQIEYDIEFKYHSISHNVGIGYDWAKAQSKELDKKCIYIYIDGNKYCDIENAMSNGKVEGNLLSAIGKELEVSMELADAVKKGNIISDADTIWYGKY